MCCTNRFDANREQNICAAAERMMVKEIRKFSSRHAFFLQSLCSHRSRILDWRHQQQRQHLVVVADDRAAADSRAGNQHFL